jgi:ketosteroid isomerase-like protein
VSPTSAARKAEHEIRDVLLRINQAWLHGDVDDLRPLFHENVLVMPPGELARVRGREPCVQSYREFVQTARVRDYVEHDLAIDVFGDTAVATYRFDITYEINGKSSSETGIDLFVFSRIDDSWRAVFRTLLPLPGPR